MWCGMSEYDDNTNLQEDFVHIHLSGVAFHVLCVGVGRLVVRFHHAYVIPSFLLENGFFEVLSLHTPPVTVDRCQL